MRLPVLSQAQFEELSRLGQVNPTTSDGVPVWTFKSIPNDIRKQAPSNLEAVQASISQSAQHLEAGDSVSLVAFADSAQILLSGLAGSERAQVLDAVAVAGTGKAGRRDRYRKGLEAGLTEAHKGMGGRTNMVNRVLVLTDGFTQDPDAGYCSVPSRAVASGIAVSTIGIGTEFNEKLLLDMADASLGNAYFARNPARYPPPSGKSWRLCSR